MAGDLMDLRRAANGSFMILTEIENNVIETWEPAATYISRHQMLSIEGKMTDPPMSIFDALVAEGWVPPDDYHVTRLDPLVCPTCGGRRCFGRDDPPSLRC